MEKQCTKSKGCENHQNTSSLNSPTNSSSNSEFNWSDLGVWKTSAKNTAWCLLGCVIGDFGAILWFQTYSPETSPLIVVPVAMLCGILTSIALETFILSKQMLLKNAFKTAIGMSLVSMISMEAAMNLVDYLLVGSVKLVWWAIPPMLLAGFLTPWPYNYWRLKKLGKACH
jgi:hypothetical protein